MSELARVRRRVLKYSGVKEERLIPPVQVHNIQPVTSSRDSAPLRNLA